MFRDLFESLEASIPGFRFICVVARDGIEVGSHQSEEFPHEVLSAEMNGVLQNLERMSEEYEPSSSTSAPTSSSTPQSTPLTNLFRDIDE